MKTFILGVGFKDFHAGQSSQHLFAEVVLIDKTHEALSPKLYQLKKNALSGSDDLSNLPRDLISIQRDAFMLIGEVLEIDKKKKLIHLSNENIVSYNHLIVATGSKTSCPFTELDREFSDGLQTLIDALRVKKIPTSFREFPVLQTVKLSNDNMNCRYSMPDPGESFYSKNIQKIVSHHMLQEAGKTFSLSLNGIEKLYQVVI